VKGGGGGPALPCCEPHSTKLRLDGSFPPAHRLQHPNFANFTRGRRHPAVFRFRIVSDVSCALGCIGHNEGGGCNTSRLASGWSLSEAAAVVRKVLAPAAARIGAAIDLSPAAAALVMEKPLIVFGH
jgi:hypothetical protein